MGRVVYLSGASCFLKWGELSYESGASCLGASFMWGELSWGELSLGRVVLIPNYRHSASEAGGAGSNPGRVIPKTLKMVPVATLLGAQH